MANTQLPSFEDLDAQIREIFLNAEDEKTIEQAIQSYTFTMTMGKLWISKRSYGRRRDDGTVFMNTKGYAPVGVNESKFEYNGKKILGSVYNGAFAQAISYYNESSIKSHQFVWLSHNRWFLLIRVEDNEELIAELMKLYKAYPAIPPYLSHTIPGIGSVFSQHPLKIYRSWDINRNFKFSEVLETTLQIIHN